MYSLWAFNTDGAAVATTLPDFTPRLIPTGCDVLLCILVFVRLKPHAHMQNTLPRVDQIWYIGTIEREAARFGISDTEFIRWPW